MQHFKNTCVYIIRNTKKDIMKKGILITLAALFSLTAQSQKAKLQERDFYPQQDEGGVVFHRDHSNGEVLAIGYKSSYYGDTVFVYYIANYEFEMTDNLIFFNCKFANLNINYKKKKGQIKGYYDRGDKNGITLMVGTYETPENGTLMIREWSEMYDGGFSGDHGEIIIKKGNEIHVFHLM